MQAFVEELGTEDEPTIPVNFSSDPTSTAGEADVIMQWRYFTLAINIGLAATFNPDIMRDFSKTSSEEYQALGAQIDLATEPRWLRVDRTFGEGSKLATGLAEAYTNES